MPDKDLKQIKNDAEGRWNNTKKVAGSHTAYYEYDAERYRQKKALKALLDEYEFAIGDDKTFASVIKDIRANLDIDATAQSTSKYNAEKKNYKQIKTALYNVAKQIEKENDKLIKERDELTKKFMEKDAPLEKLRNKEEKLIVREECTENKLIIAHGLMGYYDVMTNGGLEIPETRKTVRLTLSSGEVTTKGDGKYSDPDTTYFIDTTGVKIKGGFKDGARGFDDNERVEITDVDAKDEPLFPHEPSMNDIAQGGLGDCWFVNNIANVARLNPQYIRNMMRDNGDGTVTVRLYGEVPNAEYEQDHSKDEFVLKPVYVKVDKKIPNDKGIFYTSVQGADNCLWVNMIERAAAAIGLGSNTKCRLLPPDYKERYAKLKGQERTYNDTYKDPWFFTQEDNAQTFSEFAPSYEVITGGYNRHAINMLMGPDNHSKMIEIGKAQYSTEINMKRRVDQMVMSPALITEMAFKESILSHKNLDEKDKDIDIGLLLSRSDTVSYGDNPFNRFANSVIDESFVTGENKNDIDINILYVNQTCKVPGLQRVKNSILDAADKAFAELKKDELFYVEVGAENEKAVNIIKNDEENKLVMLGASAFDTTFMSYISDKLAKKMKQLLEAEISKKPGYGTDTAGRKKMIEAAAEAFKKQEFTFKDFKKEDFPPELLNDDHKIENLPSDKCEIAKRLKNLDNEQFDWNANVDITPDIKNALFEKYTDVFIKKMQDELAASLGKVSELQGKAHERYDENIGKIFELIQKGVNKHVVMAAGVHHKTRKLTPEEEKTHLPVGHAYSIINAYEKDGQRYITLRNPWGDSNNNGIKYVKGKPVLCHVKDGVFDLKFEDFFDQVDDVSYDYNLETMPEKPVVKEKREENYLTAEIGHSFLRVLKDTYFDLLNTKSWPYSHTSNEFDEMMKQLKETVLAIPDSYERNINEKDIGLQEKITALKKKITVYTEHCKGAETDGRHPVRLKVLKNLTDCLDKSLTADSVKDPREEGIRAVAEKMVKTYYARRHIKNGNLEKDVEKILGDATFLEQVDDINYAKLESIKNKEASKMMDKVLNQRVSIKATAELGLTK